jgi:pyruvate/2-oxoglutarate dehydrogenase complex dihydrolipoamide dehydrogenase (E3) component
VIDAHTIELTDAKGSVETVTTDKVLIAVGGRPNYLDVEGARECCITSDDIFSLNRSPGKTLVVGASYIALVNIFNYRNVVVSFMLSVMILQLWLDLFY